jgi:uncharacterized membrane protein YfcA
MELTPAVAVFLAVSGFLAALLSGLVGVGGAVVLVPILLYVPPLFGLPAIDIATATGIAVVQVTGGALSAGLSHLRHRFVDRGLYLAVAPAMTVTSFLGAAASVLASALLLEGVFATLAGLSSLSLLLLRHRTVPDAERPVPFNRPLTISLAAAVGFLAGMIGAGGAFVMIPALLYIVRIPLRVTIGTMLWVVVTVSLAALSGKAITGQIEWALGACLLVGALPGGPIGGWISRRTRPARLATIMGAVILVVAIRMWIDIITEVTGGGAGEAIAQLADSRRSTE